MKFKEFKRIISRSPDNLDEQWDYYFKELDDYKDVQRLDELINLIIAVKDGEYPIFDKVVNTTSKMEKNYSDINRNIEEKNLKMKDITFINEAKKGLFDSHLSFYWAPISHLINAEIFDQMYALIQIVYVANSEHEPDSEDILVIDLTDFIPRLSFFLEDFDNPNNIIPEYDKSFFKKITNMTWEDKKAENLDSVIYYGCFSLIFLFRNIDPEYIFCRAFGEVCYYFMACNAIREGRDSINSDDVVFAYLFLFKIVLTDIRLYVWKYYNHSKWGEISQYYDK